jgi:transposase-like protein
VRRWKNNRAENSHLPFRRPERAMNQFRRAPVSMPLAWSQVTARLDP